MGRSNQLNTLLVEIMIAVMFFAICAMVVIETFVIAHNQSFLAGVYDDALVDAQNMADELYVSGDFTATLEGAGYARGEQGWVLAGEDYTLLITTAEEETGAGVLLSAEISVLQGENTLLTLPCLRYVPGEVQP